MTTIPQDEPAPATARVAARPRRVKALFGWLVFLAVACAAFWRTGAAQDYKNIVLQVAIVLGIAGVSVWTIRSSGWPARRRGGVALLVWTPLCLVSPWGPVELINNGNTGIAGWRWRWAEKPDELLQAVVAAPAATVDWRPTAHDYPGFLGGGYWAEVKGIELNPDWSAQPPKQLWRQPIGAGWSGFAIVGDYAVTQEQRGDQELVVCYELRTGAIAWSHADHTRWDPGGAGALGGVGPRATPTVHGDRVFTHGATGILNCLDARTGDVVWTHDTVAEFNAANVAWGKAGSPLIVDDMVVLSVGGAADQSLIAFDQDDGEVVWASGRRRSSYASPVLTELGGVRQIVVVNEAAVTAHRAETGEVLWEHPWDGDSDGNASASQPMPVGGDRVFLSKGYGVQAELIQIAQDDDGDWLAERIWKKPVLRTKLGNVVVRDGFLYGIDDIDLECVEIDTGKRQWKKRRRPAFGHGQIVLVGDVILVLSESGELVLVEASPDQYRELAKMPAIEGVTWNNPALSGPLLLVRNAEEVACFELPLQPSTAMVRHALRAEP